jgi:hypothetical protein
VQQLKGKRLDAMHSGYVAEIVGCCLGLSH